MTDFGGYSEAFGKFLGIAGNTDLVVFLANDKYRTFKVLLYCATYDNGGIDTTLNGLAFLDVDRQMLIGSGFISQADGVNGPSAQQLGAFAVIESIEDPLLIRDLLNAVISSSNFYYNNSGLPQRVSDTYWQAVLDRVTAQATWVAGLTGAEQTFWSTIYTYLEDRATAALA